MNTANTLTNERSTKPAQENPHVYVGRELCTQSGIRAVAAWELLKGESAFDLDWDDPEEAATDLYSQVWTDVGEANADEGIDPEYYTPPYEHYVRLRDLHGSGNWALEALTCYLTLEGVAYPRMKAESVWASAIARYMECKHSMLLSALEIERQKRRADSDE